MAIQRSLVVGLLATLMFMVMKLAMAANYTVGAPNGAWDIGNDLQGWGSSHTFLVGDDLIFQYTDSHNVLEVTKADYENCQTSRPISSYSGGYTVIPLTSPSMRYFICGIPGHCLLGMAVPIQTLAATNSTSPSPAPPSTPATPAATLASPASSPTLNKSNASSPASSHTSTSSSPKSSPKSSPTPSHSHSSAKRNSSQKALAISFCLLLAMLLGF